MSNEGLEAAAEAAYLDTMALLDEVDELKAKNQLLRDAMRVAEPINKERWELLKKAKAENQRLCEAIDTELVCCGIGTLDSMETPKHAIAAICRWHYDLGVYEANKEG